MTECINIKFFWENIIYKIPDKIIIMKKLLIAIFALTISCSIYAQDVGIENSTVLLKYMVSKLPPRPKKADYVKILKNLPASIKNKQELIVNELRNLDNNEAAKLSKMIAGSTPAGIKKAARTILDLLPDQSPKPVAVTANTKRITAEDLKSFGIKGDGVHNDLPGLKELLESIKSEESVVLSLPAGDYYLNKENAVKVNPAMAKDFQQGIGYRVAKDVTYGSNIDWKGNTVALKMDVYTPTTATSLSKEKYPVVIFMHGGGWSNGSKNWSSDIKAAQALAERGYAVVSIDYRVGWRTSLIECDNDIILGTEAIYRSIQDLRASIRFAVSHADKYQIDTSNIYIMGSSAGAGSLLFNQYYTQQFWDTTYPTTKRLGKLDASNDLKNSFTIKGLIPMWGGMYSTSAITKENAVPTMFFHGTADPVATIDVKPWLGCAGRPPAYGSRPLYNRLVELGVPALAHFKNGGGHGVYTQKQWAAQADCFIKGIMTKKYVTGLYFDNDGMCK